MFYELAVSDPIMRSSLPRITRKIKTLRSKVIRETSQSAADYRTGRRRKKQWKWHIFLNSLRREKTISEYDAKVSTIWLENRRSANTNPEYIRWRSSRRCAFERLQHLWRTRVSRDRRRRAKSVRGVRHIVHIINDNIDCDARVLSRWSLPTFHINCIEKAFRNKDTIRVKVISQRYQQKNDRSR